MFFAICMVGLQLVQKVIELFFLFVISPVVCIIMVIDDEKRAYIWKDMVIANFLATTAVVIGFYVFIAALQAVVSNGMTGLCGLGTSGSLIPYGQQVMEQNMQNGIQVPNKRTGGLYNSAIKSIEDSLNHFFTYDFTQDFINFKSLNELHNFYQSKLSDKKKIEKNTFRRKYHFIKCILSCTIIFVIIKI